MSGMEGRATSGGIGAYIPPAANESLCVSPKEDIEAARRESQPALVARRTAEEIEAARRESQPALVARRTAQEIKAARRESQPALVARRTAEEIKAKEIAKQETKGLVTGTFKAFGEWLLKRFADAHGLGLALTLIEFTSKAIEWLRRDGLDVSVPIPVGQGVDLQLSAHLTDGTDADQPPLTVCFSPSGYSPVGVLKIGEFEIDPSDKHPPVRGDSRSEPHPLQITGQPPQAEPNDLGLDYLPVGNAVKPDSLSSSYTSPDEHGRRRSEVVPIDLSGILQIKAPETTPEALEREAEQKTRTKALSARPSGSCYRRCSLGSWPRAWSLFWDMTVPLII